MVDIKIFQAIEVFMDLIQTNISDPSGKDRWVYPTFTNKDSVLPQITVKLLQAEYEDDSNDSLLYEESTETGYKEYYYKKALIPVNIYVRTSKNQGYNMPDGFMTNEKLNLYIANQIKNLLRTKTENTNTFKDVFERVEVLGIEPVFEDTKHVWASVITCKVTCKDIWLKEYNNDKLVVSKSLTINTY